jgi:hypothetical protein
LGGDSRLIAGSLSVNRLLVWRARRIKVLHILIELVERRFFSANYASA